MVSRKSTVRNGAPNGRVSMMINCVVDIPYLLFLLLTYAGFRYLPTYFVPLYSNHVLSFALGGGFYVHCCGRCVLPVILFFLWLKKMKK